MKCKVLRGSPYYLSIEDFPVDFTEGQIIAAINEGLYRARNEGIASYTITLKSSQILDSLHECVLGLGLMCSNTRYYYRLDLNSVLDLNPTSITLKNLTEIDEALFMTIWEEAKRGSLNSGETTSVEKTFIGLQEELGSHYLEYCNVGFIDNNPIGITIPHLEPGTEAEGRLFYFGLRPEWRGQQLGTLFHRESLLYLKKLGMSYYIGATDDKNVPMQRIFIHNGCQKFDERVTYRIHLDTHTQ